jgi:hypothetical protein
MLTLPLVVLASLSMALTSPAKASAYEINQLRPGTVISRGDRRNDSHDRYSVFYRRSNRGRWHLAGNYRNRLAADRTARHLRRDGLIVRVEHR